MPVYSRVAGSLPVRDILDFTFKKPLGESSRKVGFVRTTVNVTTAGKVLLKLNDLKDVLIWIDGKPVDPAEAVARDLAVGAHKVTLGVDLNKRSLPLRLDLPVALHRGAFLLRPNRSGYARPATPCSCRPSSCRDRGKKGWQEDDWQEDDFETWLSRETSLKWTYTGNLRRSPHRQLSRPTLRVVTKVAVVAAFHSTPSAAPSEYYG